MQTDLHKGKCEGTTIKQHDLRMNRKLFERRSRIAGNSVYDKSGRELPRRRYQGSSRSCLYARTAALCGANCGKA